jgi:hypothetical protein
LQAVRLNKGAAALLTLFPHQELVGPMPKWVVTVAAGTVSLLMLK